MTRIQSLFLAIFLAISLTSVLSNAGEVNIAVIDMQRIMSDSLSAKSVQEQVVKTRNKFQDEMTKKEADLAKNNQEISKQQSLLSQEAFEEKLRQFNDKVATVQHDFQTKKAAFDQATIDAAIVIEDAVNDIVAKLAKEKSYSLVIPTSQILYSDNMLDITDYVLKSLNARLTKVELKIDASVANKK